MSEKINLRFIVNPNSGVRHKLKSKLDEVLKHNLDLNKFDYEIWRTEYAGHAIDLAHKAVDQGIDCVVGVGGDGTLNEISQVLIDTDTQLGVLPFGSGNGFSSHLRIGRNIQRALERINQYQSVKIDTASIGDKKFINAAGFGLDALVAYKTKLSKRRGFVNYFRGSMSSVVGYKSQNYNIKINGEELNRSLLSFNLANGSMYGYNFYIAPKAKMDDGYLNALLIKDVNKARFLAESWRYFVKRIDKSDLSDTYETQKCVVKIEKENYMHIDGEGYKCQKGEYLFIINKNSLSVIC